MSLTFMLDGKTVECALPSHVLVSGADMKAGAARFGLGLA